MIFVDCFLPPLPVFVRESMAQLKQELSANSCERIYRPLDVAFDGNSFCLTPEIDRLVGKVRRALLLQRPILIEGSPGVGKTFLPLALAEALSVPVIRMNLSEQTDVSDLLGIEVPRKDGGFEWRDGALLAAVRRQNCWIVLDELNLANQNVLEALNGCFDHRHELFVPDLGEKFNIDFEKTKIFATQNPHEHGHGRKGLPKSFLNRFIKIKVMDLPPIDIAMIARWRFGFEREVPLGLNVRDALRYSELVNATGDEAEARSLMLEGYFAEPSRVWMDANEVRFSQSCVLKRRACTCYVTDIYLNPVVLGVLRQLSHCVNLDWPVILCGETGCGKLRTIKSLAAMIGVPPDKLIVMSLSSASDTFDLLGSYEQCHHHHHHHNDNQNDGPTFKWVESRLIHALRNGFWIVLRNINRCSTSVLDRLNPLLEADKKSFSINEAGIEEVRRHCDARIFLTMDPRFGPVSAALRNRSVTIEMKNGRFIGSGEASSYMYGQRSIVSGTSSIPPMPNNLRLLMIDAEVAMLRPIWFVFQKPQTDEQTFILSSLALERCSKDMLDVILKRSASSDDHVGRAAALFSESMSTSAAGTNQPLLKSTFPDLFHHPTNKDFEEENGIAVRCWLSSLQASMVGGNGAKYSPFLEGIVVERMSLVDCFTISFVIHALLTAAQRAQDEEMSELVFCQLTAQKLPPSASASYLHYFKVLDDLCADDRVWQEPSKSLRSVLSEKKADFACILRPGYSVDIGSMSVSDRLNLLHSYTFAQLYASNERRTEFAMSYRLRTLHRSLLFSGDERDFLSVLSSIHEDCSVFDYAATDFVHTMQAIRDDLKELTNGRNGLKQRGSMMTMMGTDAMSLYKTISEPALMIDPEHVREHVTNAASAVSDALALLRHLSECILAAEEEGAERCRPRRYLFEKEIDMVKDVLEGRVPRKPAATALKTERDFNGLMRELHDFNAVHMDDGGGLRLRRRPLLLFMNALEEKYVQQMPDLVKPLLYAITAVCVQRLGDDDDEDANHGWPLRTGAAVVRFVEEGLNMFHKTGNETALISVIRLAACTDVKGMGAGELTQCHTSIINSLMKWWNDGGGETPDEPNEDQFLEIIGEQDQSDALEQQQQQQQRSISFTNQCILELYESVRRVVMGGSASDIKDQYRKFVDAFTGSSCALTRIMATRPNFSMLLDGVESFANRHRGHLDFYTDPNPDESVHCFPLLRAMHDEACRHSTNPLFADVQKVTGKILWSLSVFRSPLAAYLMGLDLLFCRIEAANMTGNVLFDRSRMQNLCSLMIRWREIELRSWETSLNRLSRRLRRDEPIRKFWLALYTTLAAMGEEEMSASMISSLFEYLNEASVGDLEVRCEMLETSLRLTRKKHSGCGPLLNMVGKFRSYVPNTNAFIENAVSALRKQVTDAVKLCSWTTSLNYHAVRSSCVKSKTVVLKCRRKLSDILKERATGATCMKGQVPLLHCPQAQHNLAHTIREFLLLGSREKRDVVGCYSERCVYLVRKVLNKIESRLSQQVPQLPTHGSVEERIEWTRSLSLFSQTLNRSRARLHVSNVRDLSTIAFTDVDNMFWCLYVRYEHFVSNKSLVGRKQLLRTMLDLAFDCVHDCLKQRNCLHGWCFGAMGRWLQQQQQQRNPNLTSMGRLFNLSYANGSLSEELMGEEGVVVVDAFERFLAQDNVSPEAKQELISIQNERVQIEEAPSLLIMMAVQCLFKWNGDDFPAPPTQSVDDLGGCVGEVDDWVKCLVLDSIERVVLPFLKEKHMQTLRLAVSLLDVFIEAAAADQKQEKEDEVVNDGAVEDAVGGLSGEGREEKCEDVSNELEFEEQVEGLRDEQQQQQQQTEERNDENDEGLEMGDDFDNEDDCVEGDLDEQDLDNEFGKNESKEGEEKGQDEVLDEKLWKTENDEDEELEDGVGGDVMESMDADNMGEDEEAEVEEDDKCGEEIDDGCEENAVEDVDMENADEGSVDGSACETEQSADKDDNCRDEQLAKEEQEDELAELVADKADDDCGDGIGSAGGEAREVNDPTGNDGEHDALQGTKQEEQEDKGHGNEEKEECTEARASGEGGAVRDENVDGLGLSEDMTEKDAPVSNVNGNPEIAEEENMTLSAEKSLEPYNQFNDHDDDECLKAPVRVCSADWTEILSAVSPLAAELSEKLRVVLEPTRTSRLQGDYKTGRRLNMRRVISYIASDYRQDRIWLRRTKPDLRDIRVLLAIDNSRSMEKVRLYVPHSIALLSHSLDLLNGAKVGLMTFGNSAQCLHGFNDGYVTSRVGQQMFDAIKFNDERTDFVSMLQKAVEIFDEDNSGQAQQRLLVVVSDGFVQERSDEVRQKIEQMMSSRSRGEEFNDEQAAIFVILILMDCHEDRKFSLLTMKHAHFDASGKVHFKPVMDDFPFPYYVTIQSVDEIPNMLACSLYQWFEMVASSSNSSLNSM